VKNLKEIKRLRRKRSIRKKISGFAERPRLTVSKSNGHIYAQLINDDAGVTLVSASTIDKEVRPLIKPEMTKVEQSKIVGKALAERAIKAEIKSVTFDRNGNIYHGRVKALADAAREGGLQF